MDTLQHLALAAVVGGVFGIVLGFGVRIESDRAKSAQAVFSVACVFGIIVMVGMVPPAVALTLAGAIAVCGWTAIALPARLAVVQFMKRFTS